MTGERENPAAQSPAPGPDAGVVRVLSVQTPTMGHGTYGRLIRQYLADAPSCRVDSVWADADKDLPDRVLNRLLALNLPGRWAARRNFDLRRFRTELGAGLIGRRQAQRQMRRCHYDVLHFHTQVPACLSLDLMRRTPTVLSGDMTAVLVAQEAQGQAARWTFAPNIALERRLCRAAAHVVLWSNWAARSVIGDYGIDPARVSVISPSVDVGAFPARADAPHARSGPVRLLFVGGDFARKGGPDLLDVFSHEFAHAAELHLVTAATLDRLPPNVHVHHGVTAYSPEWQALYQSMDVFVLPTRAEAFGLVFLEAMAAGLPVVATRINAIPEIVTDGETGLLIAPGDRPALAAALRLLIGDADLRRRMGRAGRAFAERRFDVGANFRRLEAVFAGAGRALPDGPRGLGARPVPGKAAR